MSKALCLIAITLALSACSQRSGKGGAYGIPNTSDINGGAFGRPGAPNANGGVDVGNMTTVIVPLTSASITYPSSWSSAISAKALTFKDASGSIIEAKRSDITDITSPDALSLQRYLQSKHPGRTYQIISINGLKGVRADMINTDQQKQSDIYLVSELKDFIHIESNLKKADNGIALGDKIISTVRVEYRGVAYPKQNPKTVRLSAYNHSLPDYRKAAYSLLNDCYTYVDSGCKGVSILFGNGYGNQIKVGTAGYDHGRIIELGPESEVPFGAIRIEGKYLIAPTSRVPLSDIYTAFTPKDPRQEQASMQLKEGYVYLVRTISWPDGDVIAKVKVEGLEEGKAMTMTYAKLAFVEPKELTKQVDLINKHTLEYEKPMSTGEVTIYSRTKWNSYSHASFNFEYSTSGNAFITRNVWDLLFGNSPGQTTFTVPGSVSEIGEIIDVGPKSLSDINLKDYPSPNQSNRWRRVEVIQGHTYLVYRFDFSGKATYGAVRVLEIGPEGTWVRLQFRRVAIQAVGYFQDWIPLALPEGIPSVSLVANQDRAKSVFYPFINKRGDQGYHYYDESMDFYGGDGRPDLLSVDRRPYGAGRGFMKLGRNIDLEGITLPQVEALRGQLRNRIDIQPGDVIAVLLENYYNKTVMVLRIDKLAPGKSVQMSMKYLARAKTKFSDDKD